MPRNSKKTTVPLFQLKDDTTSLRNCESFSEMLNNTKFMPGVRETVELSASHLFYRALPLFFGEKTIYKTSPVQNYRDDHPLVREPMNLRKKCMSYGKKHLLSPVRNLVACSPASARGNCGMEIKKWREEYEVKNEAYWIIDVSTNRHALRVEPPKNTKIILVFDKVCADDNGVQTGFLVSGPPEFIQSMKTTTVEALEREKIWPPILFDQDALVKKVLGPRLKKKKSTKRKSHPSNLE